jgi:L-lactate dehydrogenase complex protein LldF
VHVVVMGIEKVAPTWDDAAAWLALLARSATGQPLSIYTTAITGPARPEDPDGPSEVHIVLLDNGRSKLVGTSYEEILQCLRCGACLNVCPVYREAGGHAYGSPYSGPVGAVISPLLFGLEEYEALPQASSLCGACLEVCPVRIDLPRMLLELRADEVEDRIIPWHERLAEEAAAFVLMHERLLRLTASLLRQLQRPFARGDQVRLPGWLNPAGDRPLPALARKSFRQMWNEGNLRERHSGMDNERTAPSDQPPVPTKQ